MNQHIQRSGVILASVLLAGLGTQPSFADGGHNYGKHGYKQPYGHQYYRYYPAPNYRRHNSDDDEKLIYGLLVGGLFGYVIGNAQQDTYAAQQYVPAVPATPPQPAYEYSEPASTCLQEREYQMKVIVGGKEAQAYGTACLQPDGSWYRGPAKVVSR
ncbi:MAG: hypothetical protein LJE58_04535 [Thiogranum sp.]|jgi:hypothetical protein|nr:hypothetical protein [Thiogranum sp.]